MQNLSNYSKFLILSNLSILIRKAKFLYQILLIKLYNVEILLLLLLLSILDLNLINNYKTPRDKMVSIINCCKLVSGIN